ncbi:MAG: adenylate kinase [Firmicutes bacterium]|nr:adenylate kinase [Bacillota bacterium]MBQ9969758.1 adenylate kinase [Oscillospiraceae bacterium]
MKKVIIIGCPGSGKSTFARKLQSVTGLPLHHLDLIYWKSDRTIVPREEFLEKLHQIMAQEQWIIDGNYASTMEMRMQACDTVIFLDYPPELCLAGAQERKGKVRPDLPWVESNDLDDSEFMKYIRKFHELNRPTILSLLEKYSDKEIIIFHSREDAEIFLQK